MRLIRKSSSLKKNSLSNWAVSDKRRPSLYIIISLKIARYFVFFPLMTLKILSLVLCAVSFFSPPIQRNERKSSVRLNFAKAKSSRLSNLATPFVRISMCHADRNIFNSLVYPYSITHTFFFCNSECLTEYVTSSVLDRKKKKEIDIAYPSIPCRYFKIVSWIKFMNVVRETL